MWHWDNLRNVGFTDDKHLSYFCFYNFFCALHHLGLCHFLVTGNLSLGSHMWEPEISIWTRMCASRLWGFSSCHSGSHGLAPCHDFMYQFGRATVPRYLVKHYPGCVPGGILWMWSTIKAGDFKHSWSPSIKRVSLIQSGESPGEQRLRFQE